MNKTIKNILFFTLMATVVIFFSACNKSKYKGFKQDESGFYYKIHTLVDTSRAAEEGDVILFEYIMRTADSTFAEDIITFPVGIEKALFKGDIGYAMLGRHIGDSLTLIFDADTFTHYYFNGNFPLEGEEIFMDLIVLDMRSKAELEQMEADFQRELEVQESSEEYLRNEYITTNNIKVSPTESGLYYIPKKVGKGKKAEYGKMVSVEYTGKLLNGNVFDSSTGRGPIEFILGAGQVIPGWEEGIAMMNEGGEATFIIPSKLAYGSQDSGVIPPFSTLVFDVKLVEVKELQ